MYHIYISHRAETGASARAPVWVLSGSCVGIRTVIPRFLFPV